MKFNELKTMTQTERVHEYLKRNDGITPIEALNRLGIFRLASRISDLKKEGVDIKKKSKKVKNMFGEQVTVAYYYLEEKELFPKKK